MKAFGKQLAMSTAYVAGIPAILVGGAKWNSILSGDFQMFVWPF